VYEEQVRFEHDGVELDVVQALADAGLLVRVVNHGQLQVAVLQLDALDAGDDVVDVAAEPRVKRVHVLAVHVQPRVLLVRVQAVAAALVLRVCLRVQLLLQVHVRDVRVRHVFLLQFVFLLGFQDCFLHLVSLSVAFSLAG